MNPTGHAVRLGLRRGLIEFGQSLRSTQDHTYYVTMAALVVGYLYIRRDSEVPGTDLLVPAVALPSILGGFIAYGAIITATFTLSLAREDGTLLRAKAVPHGLRGYFTGLLVSLSLVLVEQQLFVLIPCLLLFDGVTPGGADWLMFALVIALGLLATLPLGMVLGALVPSTQKIGSWAMLPVLVLVGISGIFFPVQQLWSWVQGVAQVFPVYWLGLGMRSAFLPDTAAAVEIAGNWRTTETLLVLSAWAAAGWALVPVVLRRMARRQSGSHVQAARDEALQWIK